MKLYLKILFCLVLTVLMLPFSAQAAEYGNQRRRNGQNSEKQEWMEQKRQEAQKDFAQVDDALKQILQKVQLNQRPEPAEVEAAAAALEANKRNAQVFDEEQKAQYMLLQSWTGFCQGNSPIAFNWSIKACKTDPDNQDAWITQGLFSMLNGKRPLQPKPPKPEKKRPNYNYGNRRQNDEMAPRPEPKIDMASLYGRRGVLDFDMTTLRSDMMREQIGRFEYLAADGSTVEYKPGRDTLCALFWQSEDEVIDPNNLDAVAAAAARRQQQQQDEDKFEVPQELTIEKQRQYFKTLHEACKEDKTIKFLQINTTMPQDYNRFMQTLPVYNDVPYPTVVAAADGSNAQSIAGTNALVPFMLIADKKGDVKYAGPARDFMAAFILTETTGVPINLQGQGQTRSTRPGRNANPMVLDELMMLQQSAQAAQQKTDPNKPAADPNAVTMPANPAMPQTNTQGKTYRQLPLEESFQAGKDLEYANMYIDAARKKAQTYKKGVELCRKIIKNYPDSIYEQQARELLRKVPEHKRATYGITNDELGLH